MNTARIKQFILDHSTLQGTDTPKEGAGHVRIIDLGPRAGAAAEKVWGEAHGRAKVHDVYNACTWIEAAMRGAGNSTTLGSGQASLDDQITAALVRFSITVDEFARFMSLCDSTSLSANSARFVIVDDEPKALHVDARGNGATTTVSFSRAEVDMARALAGDHGKDALLEQIGAWRAAGGKLAYGRRG